VEEGEEGEEEEVPPGGYNKLSTAAERGLRAGVANAA